MDDLADSPVSSRRTVQAILIAVVLLFVVICTVGIAWGLPSRKIDKYLFGDDPPWPGEKIYRLAGAAEKFSSDRGADVDVDPLQQAASEPILLTETEDNVAKIYLRYRLYTYQPDEMITMMALAGMNPRKLELDPRLYQYGGLFIYPIGALIGACDVVGLIDVRGDVVYYLDNPDEFGKFYIVARAYAAAWGVIGVLVVFAITRRLAGSWAGLMAALLFTLMPVVICMAHEGKPHLPGAVLMLMAVLFAMRYLSRRAAGFSPRGDAAGGMGELSSPVQDITEPRTNKFARTTRHDWWFMCFCCGAAFGMVLSSWPIFVLIPLVGWRAAGFSPRGDANVDHRRNMLTTAKHTIGGILIGAIVYLITNPYILINAFVNRGVLRSNFGNSLAMYEIARIGEGFLRVLELTVEGVTLPILVLGVVALIVALVRRNSSIVPLAIPAVVLFLQFVLIGAGKPAEYGRFGIFANTALAIGTACLLTRRWTKLSRIVHWIPVAFVALWIGFFGWNYLWNFYVDTTTDNTRLRLAASYQGDYPFGVLAEPAPYCFPPVPFHRVNVYYFASQERWCDAYELRAATPLGPVDRRRLPSGNSGVPEDRPDTRRRLVDHSRLSGWIRSPDTPISWANKPFEIGCGCPYESEDE